MDVKTTADPLASLFAYALFLHRACDLPRAELAYHDVLRLAPQHAGAFRGLGVIAHHTLRYSDALAWFDQAIARRPDWPEVRLERGFTLLGLKRYQAALAAFEIVLAYDPDHASASNARGTALMALGRREAALMSFSRACTLQPSLAHAWNNLCATLLMLDRAEEMLAIQDRMPEALLASPQVQALRTQALQRLGQNAEPATAGA
jgi:tetratricopeptide (TPR) repeat protein